MNVGWILLVITDDSGPTLSYSSAWEVKCTQQDMGRQTH